MTPELGGIRVALGDIGRLFPPVTCKRWLASRVMYSSLRRDALQVGHRGWKPAIEWYSMVEMASRYCEAILREPPPEVTALSTEDGGEA